MKKRLLTLIAALTLVAMVLSACGGGNTQPPAAPPASAPDNEPAPKKEAVVHVPWNYDIPPNGHFNMFGSTTLSFPGSPYTPLITSPLALFYWSDQTWEPQLATDWPIDGNVVTINLRQGVKWSDGTDFTSNDLAASMWLGKAKNHAVWRYLESFEVTGDHQMKFTLQDTNPIAIYYLLKTMPQPASVYGEYAEKVADLYEQGLDNKSDEMKAVLAELDAFRPSDYVASGPFKMDVANITEAQLTLNKREDAWNADIVQIDKIIVHGADAANSTPLILDKVIDFSTHAYPPASEAQFAGLGARIIRFPYYTGPAIFFNYSIYPFEKLEFRQAIAYAIDRNEVGMVALADSGKGVQYMTGMADPMAESWLSPETLAKMNKYEHNPEKAKQIFEELGFTKASDGNWIDDRGNRIEFDLMAPASWTDWTAAATNVAEQLTEFGIKTSVRGGPSAQHHEDIRKGQFQVAFQAWGASTPHPMFSYLADLVNYNAGGISGDKENPGMNWPLQVTYSGGEVDLNELVTLSGIGSTEEQKKAIEQLALAYNELLPNIPMHERYSNAPIWENVKTTGWPADGDPILLNGSADNFFAHLVVTGRLKGVE